MDRQAVSRRFLRHVSRHVCRSRPLVLCVVCVALVGAVWLSLVSWGVEIPGPLQNDAYGFVLSELWTAKQIPILLGTGLQRH